MDKALQQAHQAAVRGEVPVGAVLVHNNAILVETHNLIEQNNDPTAHAEILAIRQACDFLEKNRLDDCDLYVTLEPCTMCAGALAHARIRRLYYGAYDPKGGAIDHGVRFFSQRTCLHHPEIYGGIHEYECSILLKTFFRDKR